MFESDNFQIAIWALLIGVLLVVMAFSNSLVKRMPLSGAMIYLVVGYAISHGGMQLFSPNPYEHSLILERIAEIALLISLFSAGLKLRLPLSDPRWRLSLRLAIPSMLVTIALIAGIGVLLRLNIGAAILLGAILAPTDPVLASDVQVENVRDGDKLRFSLTGESGLNDGSAFPFVVLGLGLLQPQAGINIWYWFAVDFVWSIGIGLCVGAACGAVVGRLVMYLRTEQKEAVGLDEFLVLGLIALAYGGALLLNASTFLAVFAAALAMTRATRLGEQSPRLPSYELEKLEELATNPEHAGPLMMRAVLGFNEQLERIAEVTVVILVGALIPFIDLNRHVLILIPALILIIRPLAVTLGLAGAGIDRSQHRLICWFGVRGIGSIYYLLFAINHNLPGELLTLFVSVTLAVVATSIVVHGISVKPLMQIYSNRRERVKSSRNYKNN
ncbi:MAG: Na+/H+ antiporter [Verrucomicrobiaceae bacterium]|nr:Na+/H+ antiporter [Verrucomicrobiaceae bacterium]